MNLWLTSLPSLCSVCYHSDTYQGFFMHVDRYIIMFSQLLGFIAFILMFLLWKHNYMFFGNVSNSDASNLVVQRLNVCTIFPWKWKVLTYLVFKHTNQPLTKYFWKLQVKKTNFLFYSSKKLCLLDFFLFKHIWLKTTRA